MEESYRGLVSHFILMIVDLYQHRMFELNYSLILLLLTLASLAGAYIKGYHL